MQSLSIPFVGILCLLLTQCQILSQPSAGSQQLSSLCTMMEGSFSSKHQSDVDSNFYPINLHMKELWKGSSNNYKWLYVEQSLESTPSNPYRQRVYRLGLLPDGRIESKVYTLSHPEAAVFAWKRKRMLSRIEKDQITEKEGCSVYLSLKQDGSYSGSIEGQDCKSSLFGASYATSEVFISSQSIVSWDRGWNAEGEYIWGAETEGYRFDKITK